MSTRRLGAQWVLPFLAALPPLHTIHMLVGLLCWLYMMFWCATSIDAFRDAAVLTSANLFV